MDFERNDESDAFEAFIAERGWWLNATGRESMKQVWCASRDYERQLSARETDAAMLRLQERAARREGGQ